MSILSRHIINPYFIREAERIEKKTVPMGPNDRFHVGGLSKFDGKPPG